MLHWLRNTLLKTKRTVFWMKLITVSLCGHILFLVFLFFVYRGSNQSFVFSVTHNTITQGAPVVFMPMYKTIQTASGTPVKKKAVPKVKKKKETVLKKDVDKPKKKQKPKKSVSQKKNTKKKPKAATSKPKKKTEKTQKKEKKQKAQTVKQKQVAPKKQQGKQEQPLLVGRHEMEALKMQEALEQEIVKQWKPPTGLPKTLACTLSFFVSWSGDIQKITIEKSSGVLMYDISARMSVAALSLPKTAHGKEFTITFQQ